MKIAFICLIFIYSCGKEPQSMTIGQQAAQSIVDSTACDDEYDPVCGQPPMPECPQGMLCAQAMPPVKTYQNSCFMKAEKASLVNEGECQGASL